MMYIAQLLLDLFHLNESIPQLRDFSGEVGLIQTQECFIDCVCVAVVGVEHVHLHRGHRYGTSCWGMCDQIDRVAVPWFSLTHTSYHLLTLLAIEDILGQYSCWPIWTGVI